MDESDEEVEYEPEKFHIGNFEFEITTISYLPITKLMGLQQSQSEISGQKLWCGSISVMEYLLENSHLIQESCVVELGAGTGVLGMLCKLLGAQTVYLTDHDEKSLNHMLSDIQRNKVDANVIRLDWFNPDVKLLDDITSSCTVRELRLVAGDVLYKSALVMPFLALVHRLLAVESSSLLLCHVPRAGVDHAHVLQACASVGLIVDVIPPESWRRGACLEYCPHEDVERAQLYHIHRSIH